MKSFLYIMPLAFVLLAHSCSKSRIELKEGTIEIGLRKCADGTIGGNNLRLCFDSLLQDSRCPTRVMCVWQGTAVAKFSFTNGNQTSSFALSTLDMPPTYNKDTTILGYHIEFVNLHPYPENPGDSPSANKIRAEIKITK